MMPECFYLRRDRVETQNWDLDFRIGRKRFQWLQKLFCWVARALEVYTVGQLTTHKEIRIEAETLRRLVYQVCHRFWCDEGEPPKCLVMGRDTADKLFGECVATQYDFLPVSNAGAQFGGMDIVVVPYFNGIVPLKFTDPQGVH